MAMKENEEKEETSLGSIYGSALVQSVAAVQEVRGQRRRLCDRR